MIIYILLVLLGFALLVKGADFLVDGASNVAKKFHIPEIVIGLTIVAIGTSMPEMLVSATASVEGHSDIAIGNVVGSNISNLFLILGICAMINPLIFKKQTKVFENPITMFATMLLLFFSNNNNENIITKQEGIILIGFSVLFIIYNMIMAKKGEEFDRENETSLIEVETGEKISIVKSILYILIGIIALKFGGDLVVNYSSLIAKEIGISEKIISLTIIAFSTSLPELITSITASIKGETDMAIGNILGSQIFNIFLIIGVSAFLNPINYSLEYNKDMCLLIAGTLLLAWFPFIGVKNQMTRKNGLIYVVMYIIYMSDIVIENL